MKKGKLLLLGGSAQQIVAIETAKKLGYYAVVCDYLPDNPGQHFADKFYLVSTTDKEAILDVAKKEQVDGILAYASDPAAPTAAYVAEKLGLTTNPYKSVDILCNKDKFRKFLKDNGFNSPTAYGCSSLEDATETLKNLRFPIIIKPVDSSGSKGVTVLYDSENFEKAVEFAFSFSRGQRIIIEEFIDKKHPYLLGGDIFVFNGKIEIWGLLNCHRNGQANSLLPIGKSYPLELDPEDILSVKSTLQSLVDKLEINNGAMNVELVIDKNNRVWPIDIGPRCGGNMIPDFLGMIFDVNLAELSIKAAMNETILVESFDNTGFYATHNLHSTQDGVLKDITFSEELESNIVRKYIYKKSGDSVEAFDNASKALGIIFMKFNTKADMLSKLNNISNHIKIHLQ